MKNKKFIVVALVVAAFIGGGAFAHFTKTAQKNDGGTPQEVAERPMNDVDYSGPKPSDKIEPSTKDEIMSGRVDEAGDPTSPSPDELAITITQANQQENMVYIRALVSGAGSGTCNLSLTNGASTIKKTAPVGVQASYSICQGFNIPISEFANSGEWQVRLTVQAADQEVTANSKVEVTK